MSFVVGPVWKWSDARTEWCVIQTWANCFSNNSECDWIKVLMVQVWIANYFQVVSEVWNQGLSHAGQIKWPGISNARIFLLKKVFQIMRYQPSINDVKCKFSRWCFVPLVSHIESASRADWSKKPLIELDRQASCRFSADRCCRRKVSGLRLSESDNEARRKVPNLLGEYYNCPPQIFLEFSGLQDSGMDTQAPNLPPKYILTTSKITFNFDQKYFFRPNFKPVIIPCWASKSSVQGVTSCWKSVHRISSTSWEIWRLCDISSRFQDICNFSCFYIFVQFLTLLIRLKECIPAASFGLWYLSLQLSYSPESFRKIGGG